MNPHTPGPRNSTPHAPTHAQSAVRRPATRPLRESSIDPNKQPSLDLRLAQGAPAVALFALLAAGLMFVDPPAPRLAALPSHRPAPHGTIPCVQTAGNPERPDSPRHPDTWRMERGSLRTGRHYAVMVR